MEGFADDMTENVTKILEEFGNMSGLRINRDETQAMIFGHKSRTATLENNNQCFEWVNKIKVLGVTLTCDLNVMEVNFNEKYEAVEFFLNTGHT